MMEEPLDTVTMAEDLAATDPVQVKVALATGWAT